MLWPNEIPLFGSSGVCAVTRKVTFPPGVSGTVTRPVMVDASPYEVIASAFTELMSAGDWSFCWSPQ